MISTRLHGMIDYAVAALFSGLFASRALTPRARTVLGAAGAYHVSYSALTDYEAGFQPRLTMRQHLTLHTLGGAALCGAGLLMRREPKAVRAVLVAAGLTELAVVALSSAAPASGPGQGAGPMARMLDANPGQATYPPLDTPKPVADNVYIVDSAMPGALGLLLPVRMTVIRLPDGDLLLHSPTQFTAALKRQLDQLGRIRHLVAPNVVHWTFLKDWQRACPDAATWAAPNLRKRSQLRKAASGSITTSATPLRRNGEAPSLALK